MDLNRFDIPTLRQEFLKEEPFNHLVIDNFLSEPYLTSVLEEIQKYSPSTWYDEANARINNEKDSIFQSKKVALSNYNKMGPLSKSFIDLTKSESFMKFLTEVTGIEELEADPHLYGGGIHKTTQQGRLSIHSDFNIHPITQKFRRLNILLYLNKDWEPSMNGQLELWSKDMKQCVQRIPPVFNRLIIFRITDDAFHGHPEPWLSPIPRYSFALYYYTADRPAHEKAPFHWALWQQRPYVGF